MNILSLILSACFKLRYKNTHHPIQAHMPIYRETLCRFPEANGPSANTPSPNPLLNTRYPRLDSFIDTVAPDLTLP